MSNHNILKNLIIYLSYIDSLHDFKKDDIKFKHLHSLYTFYDNMYSFSNQSKNKLLDETKYLKKLIRTNVHDVNLASNRKIILNEIETILLNNNTMTIHDQTYDPNNYDNTKINKISLIDFKYIILENFKLITEKITEIDVLNQMIDYNGSNNLFYERLPSIKYKSKLELYYNNESTVELIFFQRNIYYQLIKLFKENEKLNEDKITEILKFILNTFYNEHHNTIRKSIRKNILQIKEINFPISFFNDTELDNINNLSNIFKFQIKNNQKKEIDSANISDTGIGIENSLNKINFNINKFDEKLDFSNDFFDIKMYLDKYEDIKYRINLRIISVLNTDNTNIIDYTFSFTNTNKHNTNSVKNILKYLDDYYKNGTINENFKILKKNELSNINTFFNDINKYHNMSKLTFLTDLKNYKSRTKNNMKSFLTHIDKYNNNNIKKFFEDINEDIIKMDDKVLVDTNDTVKYIINEYSKYTNSSILVFIITSFKRFGDWYQQLLGKYTYFYVFTIDYYAKLFGILNKSPVILNQNGEYYLYNFLPNKIDDTIEFRTIDNKTLIHPKSIYGLKNNLFTNQELYNTNKKIDYDRSYYKKYIKYKLKYIKYKLKYIKYKLKLSNN